MNKSTSGPGDEPVPTYVPESEIPTDELPLPTNEAPGTGEQAPAAEGPEPAEADVSEALPNEDAPGHVPSGTAPAEDADEQAPPLDTAAGPGGHEGPPATVPESAEPEAEAETADGQEGTLAAEPEGRDDDADEGSADADTPESDTPDITTAEETGGERGIVPEVGPETGETAAQDQAPHVDTPSRAPATESAETDPEDVPPEQDTPEHDSTPAGHEDAPATGPEDDEPGEVHEIVERVCAALIEVYERLETAPRDEGTVGWGTRLAALRAFRERRVAGDWDVLARLLVAPAGALGTDDVRIVPVPGEAHEAEIVRDVVDELLAAGERALVLAPTALQAAAVLRSVETDAGVFALAIDTDPGEAPPEPPRKPPERPKPPHGTVEFKRVPDVTRVQALPVPSAPETWVRGAVLRASGEAWRQSWQTELRMLQRGLLWLEQWPRDHAALESVRAATLRRREEFEAERAALTAAIEEARSAAEAAAGAAAEATAEAERLDVEQRAAEAELAGPQAEAERLQAAADTVSAEAGELTRVADAAHARCMELAQRAQHAQGEIQAARQVEESLADELQRAQEALPAAVHDAERAVAADADAAAEGHASYYRLVSAESALSAMQKKMSLGQRLHVASPPSGLRSMRAEVKARRREADEAANRAAEARHAAEEADRLRRGLDQFVADGGAQLGAAREAQQRFGEELAWLATERERADAEHREQARLAAEAVHRATEAGLEARVAKQTARKIEERAEAARTAREEALATAEREGAAAEDAARRAAEASAALEHRSAEAQSELATRDAELQAAEESEARAREHVEEICGSNLSVEPDAIAAHQSRAMARIEELAAYVDGRAPDGEVLLRTADVVVGTPVAAGLALDDTEFDALITVGDLRDADFLVGAVRTRRWILVGDPGTTTPAYREYGGEEPAERLTRGPLGRYTGPVPPRNTPPAAPTTAAVPPEDAHPEDTPPADATLADPTTIDAPPGTPTPADEPSTPTNRDDRQEGVEGNRQEEGDR
ncbi:hypothetical protein ACFHW2_14260 [Actinomadura sp. LOL_016]|uniref:hypothetical protein n=1 Tax=unclassified Actinomadura TaxID=2626254 RepID=UPI003A8073C8